MRNDKVKKYLTGISALILVFNTVAPFTGSAAATKSTAVSSANVTIVNKATKSITITGLENGDVVKVTGAKTSSFEVSGTSLTISGTSASELLVDKGGKLKITRDEAAGSGSGAANPTESAAISVTYTSAFTTAVSKTNISGSINYSSGNNDVIGIKGLTGSGKVFVYSAATAGTKLASGAYTTATTSVSGELLNDEKGTVYVSLQATGMKETEKRFAVKFASDVTTAPKPNVITATSGFDGEGVFTPTKDKVVITGLGASAKVKFYTNAKASGTPYASGTASSSGKYSGHASGLLPDSAKIVYLTVQDTKKEVSKVAKITNKMTASTPPKSNKISVFNDGGSTGDKVRVTGLSANSSVGIYEKSGTAYSLIGSASISGSATAVTVTISSGLQTSGGEVYVAVVESGKFLSKYTKIKYIGEE